MSMSFDDIQDRVQALITLGGWSNAYPSPNYASLVNWGVQQFVAQTNYNQTRGYIQTVAGQFEYQMTSDLPDYPPGYPLGPLKWLAWNDDALWNIDPANPGQGQPLVQTSQEKLREYDRQYADCAPSTPFWWYTANDQVIGLYPPPVTSGILIQFSGNRELPPLTEGQQTLPWTDQYTEAVALFGAVYYGKTVARGEELQTLGRYMKEADDLVKDFNQQFADKSASLVNRRCAAPPTNYLSTGWAFRWPWPPNSTGPFGSQN